MNGVKHCLIIKICSETRNNYYCIMETLKFIYNKWYMTDTT